MLDTVRNSIITEMEYRGAKIVLLSCFLSHIFTLVLQASSHLIQAGLIFTVSQGIVYLFFPVLGWFTDIRLTRYRALRWALIFLAVGTGFGLLCFPVAIIFLMFEVTKALIGCFIILSVMLCSLIALTGLFDATAIQFGLDQMLEASTEQLIAFIQWYYWCHEVGQLVPFYFVVGVMIYTSDYTIYWNYYNENITNIGIVVIVIFAVMFVLSLVALVIFVCSKRHFYIQRAGLNPLAQLYKVLKYSWNHTVPENRSAFTYWEEDIPSRIDLGKNKYGGPFTNEEVEDVKTFLRILLLFLTLFGFHLAGDGYSASEQFQRTSCPSLLVLLLVVFSPTHLSTLVLVIGIPVYRFILVNSCQCSPVRMLRRMWFGLLLSFIQVLIYTIMGVISPTESSVVVLTNASSTANCYFSSISNTGNSTVPVFFVNDTYLWFIIPQLLNGLASLLVSMTVLEFICAQAPCTTQGMLFGMWYATFSIRYLLLYIVDPFITERRSWLIYEGVKGFLILVSLALYSYVSKCYQYRQRNEIVNVQGMIEEIYERRLEQEEEYMQQCREFYMNQSSYQAVSIR